MTNQNFAAAARPATGSVSAQRPGWADAKDIIETAREKGSFKRLAAALESADLVSTLKGDGPYTVFAPTDAAFAKIPQADFDALLKDKKALGEVLSRHVVEGRLMAEDVAKLKDIKTIEGTPIRFATSGGKVMVNDANVTATDIAASNGVIHVIDKVIMPARN